MYRLARYASFEHWQDTRGPRSTTLGGNGPNRVRSNESLRLRRDFQETSFGGYFLQGRTATTRPVYMPGVTGEQYELVESGRLPDPDGDIIAVRNKVAARTGAELVALTYQRIRKGACQGRNKIRPGGGGKLDHLAAGPRL